MELLKVILRVGLATDTKISGVSDGVGVGVEISIPKRVVLGVNVSFSDTKNSGVGVKRAGYRFFRHRYRHQNFFFEF